MAVEQRISVYVADDHPLVRDALERAIRSRPNLEFVGASADGRDALEAVRRLNPDVLVCDLQMPELDGIAVINAIGRDQIPTCVLVLSAQVDRGVVFSALEAGARGFLSKLATDDAICDAIAAIDRGETVLAPEVAPGVLEEIRTRRDTDRPRLSEREQSILACLAEGLTAPMIAERLHLSPATVRTHLQNLYEKLGVSTQAAAVAAAMRQGLLE